MNRAQFFKTVVASVAAAGITKAATAAPSTPITELATPATPAVPDWGRIWITREEDGSLTYTSDWELYRDGSIKENLCPH